ncbi:hypothetical protein CO058_00385 [candidate division WWE3 bacterium CG_4_9_14_0_2_um_filter_35_11]|uniref:Prepilin-type cleavage/methylation domain-containing protein n=1 Tax=candidate division WWE3 bacterium CG_4_9_14_0_2_um_filter_35_11 TaxID=1975077 RepID=A0A2M8EMM8_UNCKA|nr:MAG: hypothetical protein CO058_00385 [candidate division WWE3 bacterium CG_4_9_14_0_2_um_filter_35_11]
MNKMKQHKHNGFTLIELLISIGVLGVALSITAGVLLSVIKSSQRQKVIAEVERNGEYTMSYIEKMAVKALSANCVKNSASSTCSGSGPSGSDELILGQGSTSLYIGQRGVSVSCNGATVTNNFVYASSDGSYTDSKKLTNDSVNGVNITSLDFIVSPGNPAHITVTMVVSNSSCGNWNISKTFQSFITVRGTY